MAEHHPSKATDGTSTEPLPSSAATDTDELLHEIGTPLTILSGHVQLLRRRTRHMTGADAVTLDRALTAIEGAVERMVMTLSQHSDKRPGHK